MNDINFGNRLKYALDKAGYSPSLATKELNLSQNAIGNYIKGRIPETYILYKLSALLDVSMEWLLTGTEISTKHINPTQNIDKDYNYEKEMHPPNIVAENKEDYIIWDAVNENNLKTIIATIEEEEIIRMFRHLDTKDQEEIRILLKIKNGLAEGLKKKGKSSISMHGEEAATKLKNA
ncbi:MAG: helix-turn-helix transcriptional regulator [Bacillota bacterium]|nr:helix-turn-helix transcriptional regulator [Bacillota bacterium]